MHICQAPSMGMLTPTPAGYIVPFAGPLDSIAAVPRQSDASLAFAVPRHMDPRL